MKKTPLSNRLLAGMMLASLATTTNATDPLNNATLRIAHTGLANLSAPAPEAAAFFEGLERSINYSTGTAAIAIPLLELPCGDITVSATLKHVTGGVKTEQESGPAGLGWELDCGGMVSRTICGLPDECAPVSISNSTNETLEYIYSIHSLEVDASLDIYSYKAGSHSGNFVIKDGVITLLTHDDVAVQQTATGFVIITDDGMRYEYGAAENASYHFYPWVISPAAHYPDYSEAPVLWRLTSITDPTGIDSATFHYASIGDREQGRSAKTESVAARGTGVAGSNQIGSWAVLPSSVREETSERRHVFSERKALSRVETRAGSLHFNYGNYGIDKACTSISLRDPSGHEVKRAELSYSTTQNRLGQCARLASAQVSSEGVVLSKCEISYYEEGLAWKSSDFFGLPNYDSEWCEGTESVISYQSEGQAPLFSEETYYDDYRPKFSKARHSRLPQALHGSVRSIETDKGKYVEYEYELNKVDSALSIGGHWYPVTPGLRLSKESVFDAATGNVLTRTLSYSEPLCDIDFNYVGDEAFRTVSGTRGSGLGLQGGSQTYATSGCVLESCSTLPGQPLEKATVYYGSVEEALSGDGLGDGIFTTYEYDLSCASLQFVQAGQNSLDHQQSSNTLRFAGLPYDVNAIDGLNQNLSLAYAALLRAAPTPGYFKQAYGEKAPLKKKTEWRVGNSSERIEARTTSYTHFPCFNDSIVASYYVQPLVRCRNNWVTDVEDFASAADFVAFPVSITSKVVLCDSVTTTETGDNGVQRIVNTSYDYNFRLRLVMPRSSIPLVADISPAAQLIGADNLSQDMGIRSETTECCGEALHRAWTYSSTSRDPLLAAEAARGRTSLVEHEAVMFGQGSATLDRRYADWGAAGVRLSESVLRAGWRGSAVMDSVRISSRDGYGNPLSLSRNGDFPETYGWDAQGLHLAFSSKGGIGSSFQWTPLVGCAMSASPAGTQTCYAYASARLSGISHGGKTVSSISYQSFAQHGRNAVVKTDACSASRSLSSAKVYDSQGHEIAQLSHGATGDAVATVSVLDALGRPLKVSAPSRAYPADSWQGLALAPASAYPNDSLPFVSYCYDGSADPNPKKRWNAGQGYAQKPSSRWHCFNYSSTTRAQYRCRKYKAALGGGSLHSDGYWPTGSLQMEISIDADSIAMIVFTDFLGRKVLERRFASKPQRAPSWPSRPGEDPFLLLERLDTYYVYDDAGCLCFVLQPKCSDQLASSGSWSAGTSQALADWAFCYGYDQARRLIMSKEPGCGIQYYRYDSTGELVFAQDACQRERGCWGFSIRDAAGRTAIEGEALANDGEIASICSGRVRAQFDLSHGEALGYDIGAHLQGIQPWRAFYYDGYGFLGLGWFDDLSDSIAAGPQPRDNNLGLMTGELRRILGHGSYFDLHPTSAPKYAAMAWTYDNRERAVAEYESRPGLLSSKKTAYSTSSKPLSICSSVTLGSSAYFSSESFDYDAFDRLSGYLGRHPDGTAQLARQYDGNGHLRHTYLPHAMGRIAYVWSTAGSISRIEGPDFNILVSASAGGRIKMERWWGSIGVRHEYGYSYDGAGRLLRGDYSFALAPGHGPLPYGLGNTPDYSVRYDYDKNGNAVSIVRKGLNSLTSLSSTSMLLQYGLVDSLSIQYAANRPAKADDGVLDPVFDGAPDFLDGADEESEYDYDACGRMVADLNRGIESISWSPIGRPARILFASGHYVDFEYDASGRLLSRIVSRFPVPTPPSDPPPGPPSSNAPMASPPPQSQATRYAGPFVFVGGSLAQSVFDGGFCQGGEDFYFVKDHRGSVRQVVGGASGSVRQEISYYPCGTPFGESVAASLSETSGAGFSRWGYLGVERVASHGLNAYITDARLHFPDICSFASPDQHSFDYPWASQYAYCLGDPVNFIDPNGLEPTIPEAAKMILLAYDETTYNGKPIDIGDWIISKNQYENDAYGSSSLNYILFERDLENGNKEYCLAFAGTSDKVDWMNNAAQLGGMSKQYEAAIDLYGVLSANINNLQDITVVGHSLGGGEAAYVSYTYGVHAITFNAAGVSIFTKFDRSKGDIDAYITIGDVLNFSIENIWNKLSALPFKIPTADGRRHYTMPKHVNTHSITNFINE